MKTPPVYGEEIPYQRHNYFSRLSSKIEHVIDFVVFAIFGALSHLFPTITKKFYKHYKDKIDKGCAVLVQEGEVGIFTKISNPFWLFSIFFKGPHSARILN